MSLVDVAPTILDLALEEPPLLPPGPGLGRSLLPLVRGEDPEPRVQLGYLFDTSDPEEPVNHWALWTGDLKVYVREYWFPTRQVARRVVGEVYDLARDPGEQHDLSASPDAAVRAAIREYEEVHARVFSLAEELRAGPPPAFSPEHRADQEEILRALGYTAARKVSEQPPPAAFPGERP